MSTTIPNQTDGALATQMLATFETEMEMAQNSVFHQFEGKNMKYFQVTFENEALNAYVQRLRHKNHILQREYILKVLETNKTIDPIQKQKLTQILDYLNNVMLYENQMAKKTYNELKNLLNNTKLINF